MSLLQLTDIDVINHLARQKLQKGQAEEAVVILNRIKEKNLEALLILVDCYRVLKTPFSLIQTLERVLVLKPSKTVYYQLILELKKVKKYAKAFKYAKQGEKKFSKDPDFKKLIFEILFEKKKIKAALRYLKKNRFSFSYEKFLLYQSQIHQEAGKKVRNLWVLKKLVKFHPFNILYRYLLSRAWEDLGFKKMAYKHHYFMRDFINIIPKITNHAVSYSDSYFENLVQQLWEENQ